VPEPILFELNTDDFLFQTSVLPTGYTFNHAVNVAGIEILGRSSPHHTYTGGTPITLTVEIQLVAVEKGGKDEVSDVQKSLLALQYSPEPGIKPCPLCRVTVGIFEDWECILQNLDGVGGDHNIWDEDGHPLTGLMTLTFLGIELENKSIDDWIGAKEFKQLNFSGESGVA